MKHREEYICPNPNCDYQGRPKVESYGSIIFAWVLLLFFILPGSLYWVLCIGNKYICPKCRMVLDKD